VALANIDPVIATIKKSRSPAEAREALTSQAWEPGMVVDMLKRAGDTASRPDDLPDGLGLVDGKYHLSEQQAQAILDMRLNKLTGLEQEKITTEYGELLEQIRDLLDILHNPDRLMKVIREELEAIKEQYGDERRTEIIESEMDLTVEDLITEEEVVVTLSHEGYVKAQPLSAYRAQKRGGRGKTATSVKDKDFVDKLLVASTHDTILCFSSRGKVYWKKVYEIPQASRTARGKPIVNLLPLEAGERINAILPIREYGEDQYVFMATSSGTVKKTKLTEFSRPRASGIIAIELRDGDQLIGVDITDGQRDILLFTSGGKVIRFKEETVRAMGRSAVGVRGIKMAPGQTCISLIIADADQEDAVLTATENGYGKRTLLTEYPCHGRGGQGVIAIQTEGRNGPVVGAERVESDDEVMLITNGGVLVRTKVDDISIMGRNTQGVRLIRLGEDEKLMSIERIEEQSDSDAV
jgi:DNA gyrase subunit A